MLRRLVLCAALLCPASGAFAQGCPAADPGELRAAYERWQAAYKAHDLAATMAIFAPSILFQFQGAPDTDWAGLKAGYKREFASHSAAAWSGQVSYIEASGDLADVFSEWTLVEGGVAKAHNNSVDVFRRDAACRWHIVRSLNYPLDVK